MKQASQSKKNTNKNISLLIDGAVYPLDIVTGTEQEVAIDISRLRADTNLITLDDGYGNTGSCKSAITFIDGEKGILRYRGYPIEELAKHATFIETAYLLIFGELPKEEQLLQFRKLLNDQQFIHEDMRHHFEGFPANAPPMAILASMVNTLCCFQPDFLSADEDTLFAEDAARLMSKIRTIAAASYRKSVGSPINYPRSDLRYTENFLHMMFSLPHQFSDTDPEIVKALDQILILHADHEQNCSTSTVRMVASSQANLYTSVAAGISALWGPLHGGANTEVIKMLTALLESGDSVQTFLDKIKRKESGVRLMGFGHRVYKNFDPRAQIIKEACSTVLQKLNIQDPLLELAIELEETALTDEYFIERKLYPNVDFYSGIILRAIGIPTEMFTVIFAIGRMPGWIAHWRELRTSENPRIYRPRQIYTGETLRHY
ncbi:MAG: citrate synthase [Gammaproteobacteria bacterium]|nr:citrate synthase [Gammaproteobacteria bacterium]